MKFTIVVAVVSAIVVKRRVEPTNDVMKDEFYGKGRSAITMKDSKEPTKNVMMAEFAGHGKWNDMQKKERAMK